MTRTISILGATGSVGSSTLDLIRRNRSDWNVGALTAHTNAEALAAQGMNSVFYVSEDTAHEFLSWRRALREFAPLLFRD